MCFKLQTVSFNLRVFTSKSGERCRNYNSLHMCLPLVKGPKVMGQNNNHKSNFHFLILGCKSFAVNYSLKSGTHRHHQTLGFIPGDALPGLCCNRLQFLLVLGAFSLQFCLQQVKCMLNRIQVRWLTWPLHNSPLLSLQKLFGCLFCDSVRVFCNAEIIGPYYINLAVLLHVCIFIFKNVMSYFYKIPNFLQYNNIITMFLICIYIYIYIYICSHIKYSARH